MPGRYRLILTIDREIPNDNRAEAEVDGVPLLDRIRALLDDGTTRANADGDMLGVEYVRVILERVQDDRLVECETGEDFGMTGEWCEGCGKPATHADVEGVPLCQACWDEELADPENWVEAG